jgi:anaerobic dimethyl sulfoxide reductase subunit B (iron-sulfur subunit)
MSQTKSPHFSIDLSRCTGCNACAVACSDRAGLPEGVAWLRVEAHEGGVYPAPTLYYRVVHCFHCADPACAASCPTGAMAQGADGWVQVDAGLCIACGACVEACPFGAVVLGADGAATKCDGCVDEVARGWGATCVRACPMRALEGPGTASHGLAGAGERAGRVLDARFDDHGIGPSVVYWRRA